MLEGSDHAMLVLLIEVDQTRRKKRFMYDPRCNREDQCAKVVRSCWGSGHGGAPDLKLVANLK